MYSLYLLLFNQCRNDSLNTDVKPRQAETIKLFQMSIGTYFIYLFSDRCNWLHND